MINDAAHQAEKLEKIGNKPVTTRDFAGKPCSGCGQDQAAVFFVFQEALGIESLDHIGHAGLGDFERGRDIDNPGVALGINEFEDSLEIILDCGGTAERR